MHHARISLAFSILFLLIDLAKRPFASVAQLVEQGTENPRVGGSIPPGGTKYADVAHLVERHLAKVEVASSSLVIRSILLMPIKFNWYFFDRESVQFNTAP